MNKLRNRHTGHMNAYKAGVIAHGEPLVVGKTLYFERTVDIKTPIDGKLVKIGERKQRVKALGANEDPTQLGDRNESSK